MLQAQVDALLEFDVSHNILLTHSLPVNSHFIELVCVSMLGKKVHSVHGI